MRLSKHKGLSKSENRKTQAVVDKEGLCPRVSVGAVIRDKNGCFLALYRKSFPEGLAFVAGHSEAYEDPDASLKREVKEETGIIVRGHDLILEETFENPCGKGFKSHEWRVYDITFWEGDPKVMEPDKHAFVKFLTANEIMSYIKKRDIDPAWGTFILPAIARRYPEFSNLTRNP